MFPGKENLMEKVAEDTAEFIGFMDQLFDSINGLTYEADHGKILRCAVKKGSQHVTFWYKALKILHSIRFLTPKGQVIPPSVQNWIRTLHGFIFIWKKLNSVYY